jgi:hypothetical protein
VQKIPHNSFRYCTPEEREHTSHLSSVGGHRDFLLKSTVRKGGEKNILQNMLGKHCLVQVFNINSYKPPEEYMFFMSCDKNHTLSMWSSSPKPIIQVCSWAKYYLNPNWWKFYKIPNQCFLTKVTKKTKRFEKHSQSKGWLHSLSQLLRRQRLGGLWIKPSPSKKSVTHHRNHPAGGIMVHFYTLKEVGGVGRRITVRGQALAKTWELIQKNNKHVWDPEFKPY